MKYAITSTCHIDSISAKSWVGADGGAILTFGDMPLKTVALHVPDHVAQHTAAAFNRAMQAVPQSDGSYRYDVEPEGWLISLDPAMGKVWQFQSDEITGDRDPHWRSGTASSLIDAMDQIDAIIEEHSCPACGLLVGDDRLNDCIDGNVRCWDCDEAWQERMGGRARDAADESGDQKYHQMKDEGLI